MRQMFFSCLLLAFACITPACAAGPAPASTTDILVTLRPEAAVHPRIFLTPDSLKTLRANVQTDPQYQLLLKHIQTNTEYLIKENPISHLLVGPRMLRQSRKCLEDVSSGALLALLLKDPADQKRYADFAIHDMLLAADFPDWNPSHFLDTAELSCALGIGYDWLYDRLTPSERIKIKTALIEKGLTPGQAAYKDPKKVGWWARTNYNWSQVCNGGLAVAALSIADPNSSIDTRNLCNYVLSSGLQSVPLAMVSFAPDGGWAEGPGYWGYTLKYTSYYLAALQSATGSMHGLDQYPGLADTGLFRIYFTGPTSKLFNFADAGDLREAPISMFFLSHTFDRPVYAAHHRQEKLRDPFDLIWYDPRGSDADIAALPLNRYFRGTEVGFLRSAWNDPNALWCAFKGGSNFVNHSHLDIGTFVLDYAGQRFIEALGPDNYNLPAYFGKNRYNYYRLATQGQNTLLINNKNQSFRATAPIVAFSTAPNVQQTGCAVINLSAAYPMCKSVIRGFAMLQGNQIILQDEVESEDPVEIADGFHTLATIKLDPTARQATLTLGGKTLIAEILEPADATWKQLSANPPLPQTQNPGVTKLTATLPNKTTSTRFVIRFAPTLQPPAPAITPLSQWPGYLNAGTMLTTHPKPL